MHNAHFSGVCLALVLTLVSLTVAQGPALPVRTIKIASMVPQSSDTIFLFDETSPSTLQGIVCMQNLWAKMWNAKNYVKNGTILLVDLVSVPVTISNATDVALQVSAGDYDFVWVETNLMGLTHPILGKSGKIIIANSPFLVCAKGSVECIPGGPLWPRVFTSSNMLNHAWWQGSLSLTMSAGARSLFFLVSDTLQFVYDDFYEYASQFSFLTIEGAVSDITNDLLQHDITERMRRAKEADPDMLVILVNLPSCPFVYRALEELQWAPRSVWTLFCMVTDTYLKEVIKPALQQDAWLYTLQRFTDPSYFSDPGLSNLIKPFLDQYAKDEYFQIPEGSDQTTFDVFLQTTAQECPVAYNHNFPTTFLAGELIGDSLKRSITLDAEGLEVALRQADFTSFVLTFTMHKDNNRFQDTSVSTTTIQQTGTGPKMMSPTEWSSTRLIYPMPTFEERIPPSTDLSISEIILYAFTAAMIFLCAAAFAFTIVFHDSPVIRASSPPFLALICFGLGIGSACIFFWRYTYKTTSDCHLHVWFLNLGFSISFGALFVRTLKIDRLWNARTLDGTPLSNIQLGLIFSVVVGLQLVLLILWSAISQPEAEIVSPDPIRPINNYYICRTGPGNDVLLGLMVGFSGFLLFTGAILAYRVRDVPMKVVNESKMIAVSIYNLAVFSVVIVILEVSDISRELIFIIRSALILISAFLTLILLFGSKVKARVVLDSAVTSSAGTIVGGNSSGSSTVAMKALEDQKDAEIKKLKDEIHRLKRKQ